LPIWNLYFYICVYITQMNLIKYTDLVQNLPHTGRHINACQDDKNVAVYQAYRKSIGEFAIKEQYLGGPDFSFTRMSWIKTSFLWMMFRSGWAQKEGQEVVLRIWIPKSFLNRILETTVISSYSAEFYSGYGDWKNELAASESRLQWDPDHDPFGKPLSRKAIQLGLKGALLQDFANGAIVKIEDVTPFVREQAAKISSDMISSLMVPAETLYRPDDNRIIDRIKLNND
jgi:hypothetical protein